MIVFQEISDMAVKASFTEYNDVVQAFAANAANDALDIRALPIAIFRRL
jgi:hypothetical protein